MNGANAEPWANTTSKPNKTSIKIIGASQNFFLACIKAHKSLIKSIIKMVSQNVMSHPLLIVFYMYS